MVVAHLGEHDVGVQLVRGADIVRDVDDLRIRSFGSLRRVCGLHLERGGHIVVGGEIMAQAFGQAEVAGAHAVLHHVAQACDARVLSVEHHGTARRRGNMAKKPSGVVDLAETVELVAHHIEQQRIAWLHLLHEVHGVGLVEFEHGDVGVQAAVQRHFGEDRRDDATREVGAGRVREHLETQRFKHRGDHAGGGGLAVRTGDEHHAERQCAQRAAQERGVEPFHHLAGERAAAVMEQARGPAHGFAHERGRKAIPGCVRAHRVRIGGAGICHMPASCQSCRQSCSLLLCQFILACRAHP